MPSLSDLARVGIVNEYRFRLGRNPSDAEIAAQLGNGAAIQPAQVAHAINNIRNSEEARAFAQRGGRALPGVSSSRREEWERVPPETERPRAPVSSTQPVGGAAPVNPAQNPARGGVGAGNLAYTGFDFGQAESNRDVSRSAKYAFADATRDAMSNGASGTMWHTKAGAQKYAEKYIKPRLEASGFRVLEIVGDKMRVVTREAREAGNEYGEWIDFVVGADGDNPMLAWQSESAQESFGPVESRYESSSRIAPPIGGGSPGSGVGGGGGAEGPIETQPLGISEFVYEPLSSVRRPMSWMGELY